MKVFSYDYLTVGFLINVKECKLLYPIDSENVLFLFISKSYEDSIN